MNTEYKNTMSHIGFRYTYCVLCTDVLSSVFITCDFCVLTLEFHVLSFSFCVLCYMSRTVIFFFRRRDKRSIANVRMPRWRKKECRETKTGI